MAIFTVSFASTSFSLLNTRWTSRYSAKLGKVYLLGVIGTSGVGVAAGYIITQESRQKIGFFNPIVTKSTYAVALGVNLTLNVPSAYFEYNTERVLAPFFYRFKFTAGNYGLPNFGITMDGKGYSTLLGISTYVRGHYELIFQRYEEHLGLFDLSYKNMKGTFIFTDEVGPLRLSTFGLAIGSASFDVGLGYNGNLGLAFGLSSMESDMDGGWWIRYIKTDLGTSILCDLNLEDSELTFGYNRGAAYVSLER